MRIIFTLLIIGLTTYAVIDCVRTENERRPGVPTWAWVVMILLLQPLVGSLLWLFISRFYAGGQGPDHEHRTPVAPDDDPDFLRYLQERNLRDQRNKDEPNDGPATES
ncbi:MAG TPA: PLDc N-terminal domain-containing protein [Beutenbergiaceae bacterium]|nr:PLDc N-terminal domain-containing protein [Beutenbergiaceae bacterium]